VTLIFPLLRKLEILALNPGRSAFFKFTLHNEFFEVFEYEGDACAFEILTKVRVWATFGLGLVLTPFQPCLAIFKSSKESKCTITIDEADSKLVFELACPHSAYFFLLCGFLLLTFTTGIRKTHKINIEDGKPQRVAYTKTTPSTFVIDHEMLPGILDNFPPGLEEITLSLGRQWVVFKVPIVLLFRWLYLTLLAQSSFDEAKLSEETPPVVTEMKIDANDFAKYEISPGSDSLEFTFSLKELKAAAKFCENPKTSLTAYIPGPGAPIAFSTKIARSWDADFVIAAQSNDSNQSVSQNVAPTNQTASAGASATQIQYVTPKKEYAPSPGQ